MAKKQETLAPRERILQAAAQLFYKQGYRATGINQIIDESGVAKASFYSHFPSKDELCVAYLQGVADQEMELVRSTMAKRRTAVARYMTAIEVLEPWLLETEFRGCPFVNIASEVADEKNPIRGVGERFYAAQKELVQGCVLELKAEEPNRYGSLNAKIIAERYLTIFVGAIGLCEIFHSIAPIRTGVQMVRELIE